MKRPESVTLSAQEGEAMIARLAAYVPSMSDCEVLIQVLRWQFWLVWTLQEAKLSLKRLRTLLFGKGSKPSKPPGSDESSASSHPTGDGRGTGEALLPEENVPGTEEAESASGRGALDADTRPQSPGG